MQLEISTPEGLILDASEIDSVTVPTVSGELCILPSHIPIVTLIEPGVLHFCTANTEESVAVDRGFLYLQKDILCIVVDSAVNVVDVDASEAETARKRAEDALEDARKNSLDAEEIARLEAIVRYQIAKQRAKHTAHR
jgi:F-type H+-transporting ATPase subunit epsilon